MTKKNYRLMCKKNGKFYGVQYLDPEIITGGNVMYHICYWGITEEQRDMIIETLQKRYPKVEFMMKPFQ